MRVFPPATLISVSQIARVEASVIQLLMVFFVLHSACSSFLVSFSLLDGERNQRGSFVFSTFLKQLPLLSAEPPFRYALRRLWRRANLVGPAILPALKQVLFSCPLFSFSFFPSGLSSSFMAVTCLIVESIAWLRFVYSLFVIDPSFFSPRNAFPWRLGGFS